MFFSLTFLALCITQAANTDTYRRKKKNAHFLLCPRLGDQHKHTSSDSAARITHSLRRLILCVSAGPWDRYCCYCSLPVSSSSSSSLLASVLLLRSHLPSAGNRQRRDWSAQVVDATSRCHCVLWPRRNQRRVRSIASRVWSVDMQDDYGREEQEGQARQQR